MLGKVQHMVHSGQVQEKMEQKLDVIAASTVVLNCRHKESCFEALLSVAWFAFCKQEKAGCPFYFIFLQ